jgi:hypothetical protein
MKEELTTKMHLEFCLDEDEALDLRVMDTYAQVCKGVDPSVALKKNGLTREEYNNSLDKVFHFPKTDFDSSGFFI